jgi:hypothetical protein
MCAVADGRRPEFPTREHGLAGMCSSGWDNGCVRTPSGVDKVPPTFGFSAASQFTGRYANGARNEKLAKIASFLYPEYRETGRYAVTAGNADRR